MVPFLWLERTGWFLQFPIIGRLNEPFFLVSPCRAHIRSAHARLRPLRRLRRFFLMGAATPPSPKEGSFCSKNPRKCRNSSLSQRERDLAVDSLKPVRNPGSSKSVRGFPRKLSFLRLGSD